MTEADDLALALHMADLADEITMRHFTGEALDHELKADGSPVSEADRQVEATLQALVASHGTDAFLGEEVGAHGDSRRRWIVDGIDGTIVYVNGGTGWGTQIALEVDGELVVGVSTSPAMGKRWHGVAERGASDGQRSLSVSTQDSLDGAVLTMIPPLESIRSEPRAALAAGLTSRCQYLPPDTHGALMVAEGRADLCLQLSGGPWDYAALAVIVSAAGGKFSDLHGEARIDGYGPALFSNGACHAAALHAAMPSTMP